MNSLLIPIDYRNPKWSKKEKVLYEEFIKEDNDVFIVCSRSDISVLNFFKDLRERSLKLNLIFYENLGITWFFSFFKNTLFIYFKDLKIAPKAIYHRHPGFSDNTDIKMHLAWLDALELWPGLILGQGKKHFHNFSKQYQAMTTIKTASKRSKLSIKHPKTYIIKGPINTDFFNEELKKCIIKSTSSWRTEAVDYKKFKHWSAKNTFSLPTIFQEKIVGKEYRIHVLNNYIWGFKIQSRENFDYRYGKAIFKDTRLNKRLMYFCKKLSKNEKNNLVGVDIIEVNNQFYCLESNPSPGWGSFKLESRIKFSVKLFSYLQNQKTKEIL